MVATSVLVATISSLSGLALTSDAVTVPVEVRPVTRVALHYGCRAGVARGTAILVIRLGVSRGGSGKCEGGNGQGPWRVRESWVNHPIEIDA